MKYELIKEYPGSHPLGCISKLDYSTYPEFWKKVEEVDYEIISWNLDYAPYPMVRSINSVKRKSDGEVFTIGDEVFHPFNSSLGRINKIGIVICESDEVVATLYPNSIGKLMFAIENHNYNSYLKNVKKSPKKTPLFTTEDGVDVFTSDFDNHAMIYSVNKSTFSIIKNTLGFTVFSDNYLKFSTKEKAEQYILLNKPCLSLNDLLKAWGSPDEIQNFKESPLFKKFKEAAKSKL